MFTPIRSFIALVRYKLFMFGMEFEIFHRIFQHLNKVKDHGYPFGSDREFDEKAYHGKLDVLLQIELIERQADSMGKAYGNAFRYILYRELKQRLALYHQLMKNRLRPAGCDAVVTTQRA